MKSIIIQYYQRAQSLAWCAFSYTDFLSILQKSLLTCIFFLSNGRTSRKGQNWNLKDVHSILCSVKRFPSWSWTCHLRLCNLTKKWVLSSSEGNDRAAADQVMRQILLSDASAVVLILGLLMGVVACKCWDVLWGFVYLFHVCICIHT